jgi:NAD(P)-dependent dehydrogenase (short-subunit alcohol dehydrogenase family)
MALKGKRIIVTGSASGIGEATCALLRERGATVVGFDRTERTDNVDEYHRIELTDFGAGNASIKAAVEAFEGSADGLCNIAGLPPRGEDAALVLTVNFFALRRFTEMIVPKLADGASIVNMASLAGFGWQPNIGVVKKCLSLDDDADREAFCTEHDVGFPRSYFFSKECLITWTKANAMRWHDRGIRLNSVSPGPVDSPIIDDFVAAFGEKAKTDIERVGRPGHPEEIAPAVAFLLDDESGWINGTNIAVDGGMEAIIFDDIHQFSN